MPNTIQPSPYNQAHPFSAPKIAPKSLPDLNNLSKSPVVRFGQIAADSHTSSLPEWTKSVEKPTITLADLLKPLSPENNNASQKDSQKTRQGSMKLLKGGLGKVYQLFQLKRAVEYTSRNYLPPQAKKDLRHYVWTMGLIDRFFRNNRFKLMSIVHQGPAVIKARQVLAQHKASTLLPFLQDSLNLLNNPQERKEKLAHFPAAIRWSVTLGSPLLKYLLKRNIKSIETELTLLNNVPPISRKAFEKELETLKSQFNRENANDPIESIGKVLNAGSIGQVFEAKTKSGKTLVLKMAKPKITKEYLDGYKPYIYFLQQLGTGTEPSQQREAVVAAEQSVSLLKGEIDFKQEAVNTQKIRETVSKLGLTGFQVPAVLAATERGMVLPYVGQKDFADMTQPEKDEVLLKMVPDLAKLMLLSPYKPLDIHGGNIRSKDEKSNGLPFLIDFGRQANLNPGAHQKLLRLMTLSQAKGVNTMLQSPEGLQAAEDVLTLSAPRYQKALTALAQLKALPPGSDTETAQKATLTAEIEPSISELFQAPLIRTLSANGKGVDEKNDRPPTLLNAWGSFLSQDGHHSGQGLSAQAIPRADLLNYYRKMASVMRPYFWTKANAEENKRLRQELSAITLKDFQTIFNGAGFDFRERFYLKDRIDHSLFNAVFESPLIPSAETIQKTEAEFKQAMQTLLQPGNKKGDLLVRAYRVNTRIQAMAKSLTDGLCQTEPAVAADPEAYNQLLRSVENRLRNDLQLTAWAWDKDNYLGQEKRGVFR